MGLLDKVKNLTESSVVGEESETDVDVQSEAVEEDEEGYDMIDTEHVAEDSDFFDLPKEPVKKKTTKLNEKTVNILENVAFSFTVALIMPMVLPLLLEWFSLLLKTEFSISMSDVAKGWSLITQTVATFICLKFSKKASYIFMLLVPLSLFVIEVVIYLLLMIPIW